MSHIDLTVQWVRSMTLVKYCEHDCGDVSFYLNIETKSRFLQDQESHSIRLAVNSAAVAKFERIAKAIADIMAEDDSADAPMVEAISQAAE